jgi:hypothetical protein
MNIRIGHKVRFLNEKGEGLVTRIKDKHHVYVDVDGFEIPYRVTDLVLVDTEIIFSDNEKQADEIRNESVFFVVEPDHELTLLQNEFSFYLLNSSSYHLLYTYSIRDGSQYQTTRQGELGPFQKALLKKIQKHQLKEFAYHKIEILFFKKQHYTPQIPVAEIVHINPNNLQAQHFIPHHDFRFPVWAYTLKDDFAEAKKVRQTLTDYDVERLRTIKELKQHEKKSIPHNNPAYLIDKEVDLHIEKLVDSYKGMSNHDMLQLQLRHFQKHLEEAITNRYHKVVFIHGVGNGRLKQEILNILAGYTKEVRYYDAEYKKYGLGATEVLIL